MASRYHPLYGGLWSSPHLEGLSFEGKAFFAFLCSNDHMRPSGIYRATDEQLAADTGLPVARARQYLKALVERGRIVRDGGWVFVRGYLERQPKQQNLLKGVQSDIEECTSTAILDSFSDKYPLYSQWSGDRRATVGHPINTISSNGVLQSSYRAVTEQSINTSPLVEEPTWGRPGHLVTLYNKLAPSELPRVTKLSDGRAKKAKAYLTQFPEQAFWNRAFSELQFSTFLRGLRSSNGHDGFKGDFDWLLSKGKDGSENVVKVAEGRYRDKGLTL